MPGSSLSRHLESGVDPGNEVDISPHWDLGPVVESPIKAQFKRRTSHVPNLMQMSENNRFFSFALGSAHVKFDV